MIKARDLGAIVCLGALAVLPGCSMFGGGHSSSVGGGGAYNQSYNSGGAYNTASTAPTPPPSSSGSEQSVMTPETIRDVQTTLQQNHLYSGRIDGVWGPMTERGVRRWQQNHNMNATGELDMATLQSMNIGAGNNQHGNNGQSTNGQNGNGQYGQNNGTYQANNNGGRYTSDDQGQPNNNPQPNNPPANNGSPGSANNR